MKRIAVFSVLAMLLAVPSFGDDQQKAQKEINRITAMATDFDGRRVVNLSISEMFNVPRAALVQERTQTGLNYGSLFIAEELGRKGMNKDELAAKLKSGGVIGGIANEQHVDWKQLALDAKKLNGAMDNNLCLFPWEERNCSAGCCGQV